MKQQPNPRIRPVDDGPGPDVPGGDVVCVASESTRQTSKDSLGQSVAPMNVPAFWAGLAGIFGVDEGNQHPGQHRLIADEVTELTKRPGLVDITLGPTNGCLADAPKVFQGDRSASVFGLFHNAFGYRMVSGFNEITFFSFQSYQMTARIFGSSLLQSLTEGRQAFAGSGNGFPAMNLTVAVGGNIYDAQIRTQEIFGHFGGRIFKINRNEQIPFITNQAKVSFPEMVCQEGSLPFPADKGNFNPTIQGRERSQAFIDEQAEVPGIEGYATQGLEGSHFLPVKFVGISNLGRYPDSKLGGKFKGSPNLGVGYFLKAVLPEDFLFPSEFRNEVCGPISFPKRSLQGKNLVCGGKQFDLNAKFHTSIIDENSIPVKKSTKERGWAFLPRMNSGASCPQNR